MGLEGFIKDQFKSDTNKNDKKETRKDAPIIEEISNKDTIIKQNKEIIEDNKENLDQMMVGDRKAKDAMKGDQIGFLAPKHFTPKEVKKFEFRRKAEDEETDNIQVTPIVEPPVEKIEEKEEAGRPKFNIKINQNKPVKEVEEIENKTSQDLDFLNSLNQSLHNINNINKNYLKNIPVVKDEDDEYEAPKIEEQIKESIQKQEEAVEIPVKKVEPKPQPKPEPKPEVKPQPKEKSIEEMTEAEKVNYLFKRSETPAEKRDVWLDYYYKAQKSRKDNPISKRMKQGKFTVTLDDQVIIMPDMDIYGMSSNDILHQKWLK